MRTGFGAPGATRFRDPADASGAAPARRTRTAPRDREERLYCAACGHLITFGTWRISLRDGHEHTVFNPAGILFRIGCFEKAPGAASAGRPSGEFTWFPGYLWRFALCGACGGHLGWSYTGAGSPPRFFGLILDRLTNRHRD